MPEVKVRLHGGLERAGTGAVERRLDLPPGATLLSAQDLLGVPRGEVGFFLVDGELRPDDFAPDEGATLDIYPLFGGG